MKNKIVLITVTPSTILVYRKNGKVTMYKSQRGIVSAKRFVDSMEKLATNICRHIDPFTVQIMHTFD